MPSGSRPGVPAFLAKRVFILDLPAVGDSGNLSRSLGAFTPSVFFILWAPIGLPIAGQQLDGMTAIRGGFKWLDRSIVAEPGTIVLSYMAIL